MFRLFMATTCLLLVPLISQTPVQNSNPQHQDGKPGYFRRVEGKSMKIRRSVIDSDTVENYYLHDGQYFIETPISRTVLAGDKVMFSCVVANRKGQFRWYRNDHVILSATGNAKYQLLVDQQKGNYSLAINSVEKTDEGWFHCHVEGSSPNSTDELQSEYANLFVEVLPTRPRILENSGGSVNGKEGQLLKLNCKTVYSQPVPRIMWLNHEKVSITEGVNIIETTRPGQSFSGPRLEKLLISTLSFQPTRKNNTKNIFCTITLSRTQAGLSGKRKLLSVVKLNILFGPRVRISPRAAPANITDNSPISFSPSGTNHFFWEFDIVEIVCLSEGNPRVTFSWFVDNQPIEFRMVALSQLWSKKISYIGNLATSKVTLYRVGRLLHGSFVKCEGENSVGNSEDVVALDIKFGPVFTRTENNTDEVEGVAELICEAEGNPEPTVLWYHTDFLGSPPQIVSCNSTVKIKITKDTVGLYECFAVVPGFRNISNKMWITGPKDVKRKEKPVEPGPRSFTSFNLYVIITIVIGVFILLVGIVGVLITIRCRHTRFGRFQGPTREDDSAAIQCSAPVQNQNDDYAEPAVEEHIYEKIAEDYDGIEKYCSKCGKDDLEATEVQTHLASHVLRGSFSQCTFKVGNPCTAIAAVAIVYANEFGIQQLHQQTVDEIVVVGIHLYQLRRLELENWELNLTAAEIGGHLSDDITINIHEEESLNGLLDIVTGPEDMPRLWKSLVEFLDGREAEKFAILTANFLSVALIVQGNWVFVFDSHSRDELGRPCLDITQGAACACIVSFRRELAACAIADHIYQNCKFQGPPVHIDSVSSSDLQRFQYSITPVTVSWQDAEIQDPILV